MTVPIVQSVNRLRNACFTIWISGGVDLQEYHCSILAIGLHALPGQDSTETGVYRTGNVQLGVMSLDSNYLTLTGG
ncbi:hypothetical protein TNCV_4148451 [Trichonephila clavipes]|nr:hypothetical protein TNCV_4148451 [Trichonephila clavipes]